jgi:3-oxoadipate enol-lactonase
MWDTVVESLATDYRILNYDTRGHGRSEAGSARASLKDLAGDLLAVMDAAGVDRCDLVGLSLGGMTGLHAALRYPQRIRKLVACNCRAQVDEAGFKAWDERIAALHAGGVKSLVRPTIERWFSAAFQAAQPQMMEQVQAMIAGNSERGYEACVRAIQGLRLQTELPQIALPVLYVAGAQDIGAPAAEMRQMAELTPRSRFEVLDPCGHISSMERSADLISLLRGFLGGD